MRMAFPPSARGDVQLRGHYRRQRGELPAQLRRVQGPRRTRPYIHTYIHTYIRDTYIHTYIHTYSCITEELCLTKCSDPNSRYVTAGSMSRMHAGRQTPKWISFFGLACMVVVQITNVPGLHSDKVPVASVPGPQPAYYDCELILLVAYHH